MEVKDRIRMVIDSQKLTAGAFADRIGVQRSNVSHVLSGRNKPSFEFIEKVLISFPKVQAHWLLTGKHYVSQDPVIVNPEVAKLAVNEESQAVYAAPKKEKADSKQVVKIVTFYSDFTFDTYFPNEQ